MGDKIEIVTPQVEETEFDPMTSTLLEYFDREIENVQKQIELMQSPLTTINVDVKTKTLLSLNEKLGYVRTHRNTVETIARLHN